MPMTKHKDETDISKLMLSVRYAKPDFQFTKVFFSVVNIGIYIYKVLHMSVPRGR